MEEQLQDLLLGEAGGRPRPRPRCPRRPPCTRSRPPPARTAPLYRLDAVLEQLEPAHLPAAKHTCQSRWSGGAPPCSSAPEAQVEETIYSNQDTAEAMSTVYKPVDARVILNPPTSLALGAERIAPFDTDRLPHFVYQELVSWLF